MKSSDDEGYNQDLNRARHVVRNAAERAEQKGAAHRNRGLTRDTRATVEGVLDPRSIQILGKFKRAGYYSQLFGCISTGKEANVYAASADLSLNDERVEQCRAVKVFKTSILVFKNRHQYVESEFRFRGGFAGSGNPRKMVRQWAEKEFRNLRRLTHAGLRCPFPIEIRGHLFVMEMIGSGVDEAAPRLKDYLGGSQTTWKRIYIEVLTLARDLFQTCKLIHGDLSEYNILFHQGHPYIIDVSQAMEGNHCHAKRFLKRDCVNVTAYFMKRIFNMELQEEEVESPPVSDNSSEDGSSSEDDISSEDEESIDTDEELYRRAIRRNKLRNEDIQEPPELERVLQQIETCLTADEMYNFILAPTLPPSASDVSWPDFDAEWRDKSWLASTQGRRFRGQQPFRERVKSCVDEEEALSAEPELLDNAFITDSKMSLEQARQKREEFRRRCSQTLLYVLETTRKSDHQKEQKSTDEFLNITDPDSLNELRDLATLEREVEAFERGEKTKYSNLLADLAAFKKSVDKRVDEEDKRVDEEESVDSDTTAEVSSGDEANVKFDGNIPPGMDPKEWKKQVKEANRERRKHKMKKHIKKAKIKKRSTRK